MYLFLGFSISYSAVWHAVTFVLQIYYGPCQWTLHLCQWHFAIETFLGSLEVIDQCI